MERYEINLRRIQDIQLGMHITDCNKEKGSEKTAKENKKSRTGAGSHFDL